MRFVQIGFALPVRGESTPSEADIKVTRDLIRGGQLLKIEVVGATTFAGGGAGGIRTAFAAAAATEAMVNSSLGESGSIIGSLAQMNSRNSGQEDGQSKEKQSDGNFPPNDPSGDKTVSEMLKKSRDPQS